MNVRILARSTGRLDGSLAESEIEGGSRLVAMSMESTSAIKLGVDLGGTKMYAIVLDERGEVISTARTASNGHEGAERGLENLLGIAEQAIADAGAGDKPLAGIGIGCPGVVDFERGILKIAPNLGWRDVPVRKAFAKRFGCPVTVLNDVDAGTYGEYCFGAGRGATSLLGVFPGTGLGGGFVYRGQILHGRRYSCMELGDVRLGGPNLLRDEGEWSTLEDLTSRLAISSALTVEAYRGKIPSMVGLPLNKIKSKAIAKAIEQGEDAAASVLDRSIALLGVGLSSAVSLLGPDVIVLGGGLVEKFPDRYVEGLEAQLKRWVTPELLEGLKVLPAKLGDDAGVKGAAAYAGVESDSEGGRG